MIKSLIRYRELILRLVKRDLKVRYKSSVLGFLWSVAKPLLLVVVYTFVFDFLFGAELRIEKDGAKILGAEIPYALYVMAGLLPWVYFATAVGESMNSILANGNLIKKIALPHEVFPAATVLGGLVHFLLAMPVLIAFMAWSNIGLSWQVLWLIPLIALQTVLAMAFALLLSALNVFYRDISSAFEVIITAWLFATPIIYPLAMAAEKFGVGTGGQSMRVVGDGDGGNSLVPWMFQLYMLNPMTPIVIAYRRVLLFAAPLGDAQITPDPEYVSFVKGNCDMWLAGQLGICAVTTVVLFLIGSYVFKRQSRYFADEV
jgi:ABC-type polysaccharide/polyol phosphate export permease